MEREGQRSCGFYQTARCLHVQSAIGIQGTADDGGSTLANGFADVCEHCFHFFCGVNEITFPGTDKHVDEQVGGAVGTKGEALTKRVENTC